jgi:hypothetical protein
MREPPGVMGSTLYRLGTSAGSINYKECIRPELRSGSSMPSGLPLDS